MKPAPPFTIDAPETDRLVPHMADGGLPPWPGVANVQIHRSCLRRPDLDGGLGCGFQHHMDLAIWKGRLYAAWHASEVNEDRAPWRLLLSTSEDGFNWSDPYDAFPHQAIASLRMYFYQAANGRFLMMATMRRGMNFVIEAWKESLVVREIHAGHSLGPIHTLRLRHEAPPGMPPWFHDSDDAGFTAACRELLANRPYLEQHDYGILLDPPDRMPWHDRAAWKNDQPPEGFWTFGKGASVFRRDDDSLVYVSKLGYATQSLDGGLTWEEPCIPPGLVTHTAKVWGQRATGGGFFLAYNPTSGPRYPLAGVHSAEGRCFRQLRSIHGELPPRRFQGYAKDFGAQYVRGVGLWSNDGSRPHDAASWIIYSVNKEDIWVSRIPPGPPQEAPHGSTAFADLPPGPLASGWNFYTGRWFSARLAPEAPGGPTVLELRDRDPYDYARATRTFPEAGDLRVQITLRQSRAGAAPLEIELSPAFGGLAPIRLSGSPAGWHAGHGCHLRFAGPLQPGVWHTLALTARRSTGSFTVRVDGGPWVELPLPADSQPFQRLSLRTGLPRWGPANVLDASTDLPEPESCYQIRSVDIIPLTPP